MRHTIGRWSVVAALLAPVCGASAQRASMRISGSVYDSVHGRPLPNALIQFARVDTLGPATMIGARSDASGRYRLDAIAPGKYLVGFYHPVLDSLGVEPRGNTVQLIRDGQVVELAGPSAATLNELLCADSSRSHSPLLGHLHTETSETAIAGASVTATWSSARMVGGQFAIEDGVQQATTRQDGSFTLCGLPNGPQISIVASNGADSAAVLPVHLDKGVVTTLDLSLESGPLRHTARLTGRVLDRLDQPLHANAHVDRGREFQTDPDGRFAIDSLGAGSHTLFVRAIGVEPHEQLIDVASGATRDVEIHLTRAVSLPAMVVTANKNAERRAIFEEHKHASSSGYFLTPPHLQGYESAPLELRSYVGGLPGVTILKNGQIAMRRPNTNFDRMHPYVYCFPRVFINGKEFPDAELNDDSNVIGIEVYTRETQIPSIYRIPINQPCGLIVLWLGAR